MHLVHPSCLLLSTVAAAEAMNRWLPGNDIEFHRCNGAAAATADAAPAAVTISVRQSPHLASCTVEVSSLASLGRPPALRVGGDWPAGRRLCHLVPINI